MYRCGAVGVLAAIGAFTTAHIAYKTLRFAIRHYSGILHCRSTEHINKRLEHHKSVAGPWAVITGATEGIGHAMAVTLAKMKFNIILIARTQSKLDESVRELRGNFGVDAVAIPFDFSTAESSDYDTLFKNLDKYNISVLINNVGVNYEYTNYFHEVDLAADERILKVNCVPTLRMTKYVIPRMKAKGAGAIVMLSSVSAVIPTPMLATYAGTKAFSLSFGNALHFELKDFGIDVLTATPNLVVSRMSQGKSSRKPRETFFMVNAEEMARQTLKQVGYAMQTPGHINHALMESVACNVLTSTWVGQKLLENNLNIKTYVERKAAAAATAARQQ